MTDEAKVAQSMDVHDRLLALRDAIFEEMMRHVPADDKQAIGLKILVRANDLRWRIYDDPVGAYDEGLTS